LGECLLAAAYKSNSLAINFFATLSAMSSSISDANNVSRELLASSGWTENEDIENTFSRSREIDDYLWTEELHIVSQCRITYIQHIEAKRSDATKALGEVAKRYAHVAGEFFAAQVPMRRTGLGKIRAYREGEAAAKLLGGIFSQDRLDSRKLFMIVHRLAGTLETVITADTASEASVHVNTLRELAGMASGDSSVEYK